MRTIELLAPAKNKECAIAAIDAGADAVYIGGPSFGARVNAPNTLEDIKEVCDYAHLFGAKVHVTLNTILDDDELKKARELTFSLYEAGVDALIIQDLGLLNGKLPPLELHASTQQDNATVEKTLFLQELGFSQVVLARELSIEEIKRIKQKSSVKLEWFIHGALCVGVSGRCYLSASITGRSANRGECAQLCRVPSSLYLSDGTCLAKDKYLLSMKDNNQSDNIEELIDAGVSSFKIEGRLKDVNYVRNVTAYYRKAIDEVLKNRSDVVRSSYGKSRTTFEPDLNKSFNRGFTEYNAHGSTDPHFKKENYANFDAPGFVGVKIGRLVSQKGHDLTFKLFKNVKLHNGDSLNYYNDEGILEGFRVSTVKNDNTAEIFQSLQKIKPDTVFYRNKDAEFEKLLNEKCCLRKVSLKMEYKEHEDFVELSLEDEAGNLGGARFNLTDKQTANSIEKLRANLIEKLSRLGDSVYELSDLKLNLTENYFIPVSVINSLRRDAIDSLNQFKLSKKVYIEHDFSKTVPIAPHEENLGYRANIYNNDALLFYKKSGLKEIAFAYEKNRPSGRVNVLESKHCLRNAFKLCPLRHRVKPVDMYIEIGNKRFNLDFDCKNCRMSLIENN